MSQKIAVILGGTRGIGRALVKAMAQDWGAAGQVYLTARNDADGAKTVSALAAEDAAADYLLFDLADPAAPARVAALVQERHGGVDAVILNGAYMPGTGAAVDDARVMIATNNHGTLRVLRAFLPVLRPNGRMIVVASSMGVLKGLPETLRAQFDTRPGDPDAINRVMDAYVAAVEAGTAAAAGWPDWVNVPSKVGQVAVTRAFAQWAAKSGALPAGALINAACPGLTLTDGTRDLMGTIFKLEDAQTPEAAAESLRQLATLPDNITAPYGQLVRHMKTVRFGDEAFAPLP